MLAMLTDRQLEHWLGIKSQRTRLPLLADIHKLIGGAVAPRLCAEHQQEIESICCTDQTVTCAQCVATAHAGPGHTIEALLDAQARVATQLADITRRLDAHRAEGLATVIDIAEHQLHFKDSAEQACADIDAYFSKLHAAVAAAQGRAENTVAETHREFTALLGGDRTAAETATIECRNTGEAVAAVAAQLDVGDATSYRAAVAALQRGETALGRGWAHAHGQAGASWPRVHVRADEAAATTIMLAADGAVKVKF